MFEQLCGGKSDPEVLARFDELLFPSVCRSTGGLPAPEADPPLKHRTARWLVRQAMHEGIHHLGDIRRIGETLSGAARDRRPS